MKMVIGNLKDLLVGWYVMMMMIITMITNQQFSKLKTIIAPQKQIYRNTCIKYLKIKKANLNQVNEQKNSNSKPGFNFFNPTQPLEMAYSFQFITYIQRSLNQINILNLIYLFYLRLPTYFMYILIANNKVSVFLCFLLSFGQISYQQKLKHSKISLKIV